MERKKELKQQYQQTQLPMGIILIRCQANNKYFLQIGQNLPGLINGAKVRLSGGMHPNRELQQEWTEFGPDRFTIEVAETLEYSPDTTKVDYREELALLQTLWEEQLMRQGLQPYQKRLPSHR